MPRKLTSDSAIERRLNASVRGTLPLDYRRWLNAFDDPMNDLRIRDTFNQIYSYAVPTEEALNAIETASPNGVVDIGAGTGYWTRLLRERNVDALAIDEQPGWLPEFSHDHDIRPRLWTDFVELDARVAAWQFPHRSLLLVWPPTDTMAVDTLRAYSGKTVIYIGEHPDFPNTADKYFNPATGSRAFFRALKRSWTLAQRIEIPQFCNSYDSLFVYTRRGRARSKWRPS